MQTHKKFHEPIQMEIWKQPKSGAGTGRIIETFDAETLHQIKNRLAFRADSRSGADTTGYVFRAKPVKGWRSKALRDAKEAGLLTRDGY